MCEETRRSGISSGESHVAEERYVHTVRETVDDYIYRDGTLHPDLPFLAWLMIALSKNFVASNLIKEEVCELRAS